MEPIIKVENLSKQYRLGTIGTGTLSHDITRWWYNLRGKEDPYLKIGESNDRTSKGESDYVWALKDINFEVKPGEILGIIGKNGAGKSSLLKLLSRVTAPTTGSITCHGRIASLLEVGTGFHPELTGRENIYLNGAILGMTKKEIASKFDEIVEFAGCQKYIETPVKRYSSGMYVRLAFAVAAHLEPDILVVDEVLAVGDAEFQKKAIGKMKSVSEEGGRTVLFVSHNMASIKALCSRAILLSNGTISHDGSVNSIIEQYLSSNIIQTKEINILDRTDISGSKKIIFTEVKTFRQNIETNSFYSTDSINIVFKYEMLEKVNPKNLTFVITFYDNNDSLVLRFDTREILTDFSNMKTHGEINLQIPKFSMREGDYFMKIWLSENGVAPENCLFALDNVIKIEIMESDFWNIGKKNFDGPYALLDGSFLIQ